MCVYMLYLCVTLSKESYKFEVLGFCRYVLIPFANNVTLCYVLFASLKLVRLGLIEIMA